MPIAVEYVFCETPALIPSARPLQSVPKEDVK
jgi:hypothetical protein